MSQELVFYSNRDNTVEIILLTDDVALDATPVSRVTVALEDMDDIDSETDPDFFEWPVNLTYEGAPVKGIRLKFGVELEPETYTGRLVIYDSAHPRGLVWGDIRFKILPGT
jgi:hypothetical protein